MEELDTLLAARDAVRDKKISAVELTKCILARIETLDSRTHAYNSVNAEDALKQAAAVDAG